MIMVIMDHENGLYLRVDNEIYLKYLKYLRLLRLDICHDAHH